MDIDEFAVAVRTARRQRGLTVQKAAGKADISRATWNRIEAALPVQDLKRHAVEKLLGISMDQPAQVPDYSDDVVRIVGQDLNPTLAGFTDRELLSEIEGRMLLLAGRLQGAVPGLLAFSRDQSGDEIMVSHATRLLE